jgi:hypothetical protein
MSTSPGRSTRSMWRRDAPTVDPGSQVSSDTSAGAIPASGSRGSWPSAASSARTPAASGGVAERPPHPRATFWSATSPRSVPISGGSRTSPSSLVEARAAGVTTALVASGAGGVIDSIRDQGGLVWLVAPTGRVLPPRLFEALDAAVGADPSVDRISLADVERIAGPSPSGATEHSLRRSRLDDEQGLGRPGRRPTMQDCCVAGEGDRLP